MARVTNKATRLPEAYLRAPGTFGLSPEDREVLDRARTVAIPAVAEAMGLTPDRVRGIIDRCCESIEATVAADKARREEHDYSKRRMKAMRRAGHAFTHDQPTHLTAYRVGRGEERHGYISNCREAAIVEGYDVSSVRRAALELQMFGAV